MRILHVIRDLSPKTGGPVTALKGVAASQAEAGHDVVVAATDFGIDTSPSIAGVDVRVFPCTSVAWRWSREMENKLSSLVEDADIIHIHTLWEFPTWAAGRFCRALKRPYIIRPCGMLDAWSMSQRGLKKKLYLKLVLGNAFSNAAALHFTTEGELSKSVRGNDSCNSFVIPIGVPLPGDVPQSNSFIARNPDLAGRTVVLFLGRIHYKKRPDLLIRAFGVVSSRFPDARIVLAGPVDDGYRQQLQSLINGLGLQERVVWTGFLDRPQARDAYAAADLFVLPSLQENFGISVAEAMAAGCPVLVSEHVDLAADVRASSAGIVCTNDVDSLAMGLAQLLENPDQRKNMGENGRRMIQDRFSPAVVVGELMNVYDDILTGRITSSAWRIQPE